MLDRGLLVTVNSDDPGLFASGTLGQLMSRLIESELFKSPDYYRLARNSFTASWLADDAKHHYLKAVDAYALDTGTG
jgi:adenosine deaminase